MPISVKCTDCGKALKAPDELAGKKAKCPDCGAIVPVPRAVMDAEEIRDPPSNVADDAMLDDDADAPPPVLLRQRAFPLIELLSAAAEQECDIMWERGAPLV